MSANVSSTPTAQQEREQVERATNVRELAALIGETLDALRGGMSQPG